MKTTKAKAETPAKNTPASQPLSSLEWVKPSTLKANDYNPNRVFTPELRLLKISILSSGWTQPIVALRTGQIVDGFHRWTLGSTDKDIQAMTGGLVPVVFLNKSDSAENKMATIRHNRARGKHSVLLMANIVQDLHTKNKMGREEIMTLLQMEGEEVDRLLEVRGSPDSAGANAFGKGWVPDRA